MKDTDLMPFGKYKGTPMQDVPVSYLHWLWHQNKASSNRTDLKTQNVIDYISNSLDALRLENKDLIWTK